MIKTWRGVLLEDGVVWWREVDLLLPPQSLQFYNTCRWLLFVLSHSNMPHLPFYNILMNNKSTLLILQRNQNLDAGPLSYRLSWKLLQF